MENGFRIFGFAGSVRKGSFNKALLRAAAELLPKDVELELFDLEGIPPFNADLELQPPAKVKAVDALLIATPEYNYSIPGVLKNALDWGSRPHGDNCCDDKPLAIMGASIGMLGTARAQYHLRQCCVYLNMHPLNRPEVMVPFVKEKIDNQGRLADEQTRAKIKELIESLVVWATRLKRA